MALAGNLPDILDILTQIGDVMKEIGGERGLIAYLAMLIGGFFIIQAMVRAYEFANPYKRGDSGVMGIIAPIFWGIILINFWMSQETIAEQLALSGGVLSQELPAPYLQQMWNAITAILNGFGTAMTFRGFLLAKAAGDGTARGHESPAWGAFWHILGGVLLMKL